MFPSLALQASIRQFKVDGPLVRHIDQWRWSSLWRGLHSTPQQRSVLSDWPMPLPRDWLARVNRAETEAELEA